MPSLYDMLNQNSQGMEMLARQFGERGGEGTLGFEMGAAGGAAGQMLLRILASGVAEPSGCGGRASGCGRVVSRYWIFSHRSVTGGGCR